MISKAIKTLLFTPVVMLFACNAGSTGSSESSEAPKTMVEEKTDPYSNWKSNIGVGPISSLELPADVDEAMAESGKTIYEAKCTACHRVDKKFIGPSPKGIFERRNPAWIMNMILNPDGMVSEDPMARQLLIDNNGSPMANQSLTEEEARAVIEYFRTL
jgi:mono/diheme cytochrome c family protein